MRFIERCVVLFAVAVGLRSNRQSDRRACLLLLSSLQAYRRHKEEVGTVHVFSGAVATKGEYYLRQRHCYS